MLSRLIVSNPFINAAVARNRSLIAGIMGAVEMTFIDQVHGREIAVLGRDQKGNNNPVAIADAVVTDRPENYLVIQVADCQSVLMYEPTRQVVANVHSGWRGSIDNIIGRIDLPYKKFRDMPGEYVDDVGYVVMMEHKAFLQFMKDHRLQVIRRPKGHQEANS